MGKQQETIESHPNYLLDRNFLIFFFLAIVGTCQNRLGKVVSYEYPQSMFWSKNKKNSIPLQTSVFLYKSGAQGDIFFMDMFS